MNALEYAIKMEIDGENYYEEQAALNKENKIGVVCRILAEAEHSHEKLLRSKQENINVALPDKTAYSDMKSIFRELNDFKSEIRETPTQLEFYRTALNLEQKSIDLYKKLHAESQSADEKELFQFLVEQEQSHFKLLDEMVRMLRHAEEWVESAEFGLRKETY